MLAAAARDAKSKAVVLKSLAFASLAIIEQGRGGQGRGGRADCLSFSLNDSFRTAVGTLEIL
jgi:hypothetical protein